MDFKYTIVLFLVLTLTGLYLWIKNKSRIDFWAMIAGIIGIIVSILNYFLVYNSSLSLDLKLNIAQVFHYFWIIYVIVAIIIYFRSK